MSRSTIQIISFVLDDEFGVVVEGDTGPLHLKRDLGLDEFDLSDLPLALEQRFNCILDDEMYQRFLDEEGTLQGLAGLVEQSVEEG